MKSHQTPTSDEATMKGRQAGLACPGSGSRRPRALGAAGTPGATLGSARVLAQSAGAARVEGRPPVVQIGVCDRARFRDVPVLPEGGRTFAPSQSPPGVYLSCDDRT